jgi:hypothetical protein
MTPIHILKNRFLKDAPLRRLGTIASDLARLAQIFSSVTVDKKLKNNVITELKLFTEWVAPDVDVEKQTRILKLQREILVWQRKKSHSNQVRRWSAYCLKMSGFMK